MTNLITPVAYLTASWTCPILARSLDIGKSQSTFHKVLMLATVIFNGLALQSYNQILKTKISIVPYRNHCYLALFFQYIIQGFIFYRSRSYIPPIEEIRKMSIKDKQQLYNSSFNDLWTYQKIALLADFSDTCCPPIHLDSSTCALNNKETNYLYTNIDKVISSNKTNWGDLLERFCYYKLPPTNNLTKIITSDHLTAFKKYFSALDNKASNPIQIQWISWIALSCLQIQDLQDIAYAFCKDFEIWSRHIPLDMQCQYNAAFKKAGLQPIAYWLRHDAKIDELDEKSIEDLYTQLKQNPSQWILVDSNIQNQLNARFEEYNLDTLASQSKRRSYSLDFIMTHANQITNTITKLRDIPHRIMRSISVDRGNECGSSDS